MSPRRLSPIRIVENNGHIVAQHSGLEDATLSKFLQQCFQDIIDDRTLYPAWMCLDCKRGDFGTRPSACITCGGTKVFEVATFQGRAPAVGAVFQEACRHILDNKFPHLGVIPSARSQYKDHCDLLLPHVAGIEAKGSPARLLTPDGQVIEFARPGMRRTDTEKKANSNASTFKRDFQRREGGDPKFYVLTNALPDRGWQEEHTYIDGIVDATTAEGWQNLVSDLEHDIDRAARNQLGRR